MILVTKSFANVLSILILSSRDDLGCKGLWIITVFIDKVVSNIVVHIQWWCDEHPFQLWLYFVEAEYAFKKKKQIIPINVQSDFFDAPDWLGLIIGTKYCYSMVEPEKKDSDLTALLKEVQRIMKGESIRTNNQSIHGRKDVYLQFLNQSILDVKSLRPKYMKFSWL